MFKSARLKLTLFYLSAIVFISFALTFGIRSLAYKAFEDSNTQQKGGLRQLIVHDFGQQPPNSDLDNLRTEQASVIHRELTDYILYINLAAFVFGGIISYMFAGWTLRPIEDAHKAQVRFASDASHELRTPLTVMKTENEVFLRQKKFDPVESKQLIKSNLEEIQHLELLTTNLLALAQYENGQGLEMERTNAIEIAKDAADNFKKIHPSEFKRLKVEVDNNNVFVNKASIAQALGIFLDNAVKYSPPSTPIHLSGKKNKRGYAFSVIDNGPGVKDDEISQIFERLYRGDKNRNKTVPGHGLGLSLAKEIAKANLAELSVINTGKGANFTILVKGITNTK